METNDQTLLRELLEGRRKELAPDLTPQEFMEIFAASEILKDFDLSYDEIESGIVDGGGDGGIDSIYTIVNGELAQEDSDYSGLKKDISIKLFIIQSKTEDGFKETSIDKLRTSLEELLHLSTDLKTLRKTYNSDVLQLIDRFRQCYKQLSPYFPTLEIAIYYATQGVEVHPNAQRKLDKLNDKLRALFSNAVVKTECIGAPELLSLARRTPITSFQLELAENPISTGTVGFLCLVGLGNYNKFISTDTGSIREELFEANVRGYHGDKQVNAEIQASLRSKQPEDFWWLNNGVTILASAAVLSGKTLTIKSPQVVNGLQTSREINEYFQAMKRHDHRNLLVRILVPSDPASTDRIIKATNSQTPIPPGSLRATDKIQRDIEEHYATRGLYYDRRRNYYKNLGKPINKIITIKQVAQAVASVLLQTPHDARGRPSALLKTDADYGKIFNADYPIAVFYTCLAIVRETDRILKASSSLEPRIRKYLRLHVAMVAAIKATSTLSPSASQIAALSPSKIAAPLVADSLRIVLSAFKKAGATDRVAKNRTLTERLKTTLRKEIAPPRDGRNSRRRRQQGALHG